MVSRELSRCSESHKFSTESDQYLDLVQSGKQALLDLDFNKVGELMNENHRLLQEITVSCKELDDLVDTARVNGAVGAKMTGTGRGGIQISLTPGEGVQNKVAAAIEATGVRVWKTKIGI